MKRTLLRYGVGLLALVALFGSSAYATSIDGYLQRLEAEARANDPAFDGFDARRGEAIFTSKHLGKRGKTISCADCHSRDLTSVGENIFTGKRIEPLAPSANPERLSDVRSVKKWLRRNFKDVYGRTGTPKEKGDVLLFIMNFTKEKR
ncbi:DUF1924 domain-containing protein [Hydrogenimonas sp.]